MRLFESSEMIAFARHVKGDPRSLLPTELFNDWLENAGNVKPLPIPELSLKDDWIRNRYLEVYKIVRMYLTQGEYIPEDILVQYQELQKMMTGI